MNGVFFLHSVKDHYRAFIISCQWCHGWGWVTVFSFAMYCKGSAVYGNVMQDQDVTEISWSLVRDHYKVFHKYASDVVGLQDILFDGGGQV